MTGISRRFSLGLAALVVFVTAGAAVAPARSTPLVVKPIQELVALGVAQEAFPKPARGGTPLARVPAKRPLTGEQTVLPVLGHRIGADGHEWLRVRLPGRPNGSTGWIRQRATSSSTTPWHIVIQTSERRVTVYERGRAVRRFRAIVGAPATPTPHGAFFVEEAIQLRASDVGAPFALALSARSNVLQRFAGGPGQIGLHGLMNVGGVLGTAVSHGCVRLENDATRWLVLHIGPGTPVTITA